MKRIGAILSGIALAASLALTAAPASAWWGNNYYGPWGGGPWYGHPYGGYPYHGYGYPYGGWGHPYGGWGHPAWGGQPAWGYPHAYAPAVVQPRSGSESGK